MSPNVSPKKDGSEYLQFCSFSLDSYLSEKS